MEGGTDSPLHALHLSVISIALYLQLGATRMFDLLTDQEVHDLAAKYAFPGVAF